MELGGSLQKGKSMLGKKIFGSGNDPPGLDFAPLPGAADPPCVGPAHRGSDYFMIFFYSSLSGAVGEAGSRVRARGSPQEFLFPNPGPISPSPLPASYF